MKKNLVVEITQYFSGNYYFKSITPMPKHISISAMLGGKSNVVIGRYWTHHGGGNWITEWRIKNLSKAKKSILTKGYGYIITKRMSVLETKGVK